MEGNPSIMISDFEDRNHAEVINSAILSIDDLSTKKADLVDPASQVTVS